MAQDVEKSNKTWHNEVTQKVENVGEETGESMTEIDKLNLLLSLIGPCMSPLGCLIFSQSFRQLAHIPTVVLACLHLVKQ